MNPAKDRTQSSDGLDPNSSNRRGVDSSLGALSGEAASQESFGADRRLSKLVPEPWARVPRTNGADTTYYERPMLKPPVWSIDIPMYYFVGGAAGAALALGAAIQLVAPAEHLELRRLSELAHWIGIIGSSAGAVFLIHDLGRPSRFLFMLRVFRPTSPMNMGSWILAGAAPSAIATGLFINKPGLLGTIGEICGYVSGLFGAALATYTGVLVSNTAIPVWQASRRWMPVLFAASGAATAGSIIDMACEGETAHVVGRVFGTAGRIAEIAASLQVERSAGEVPEVGAVLRQGGTGLLWKSATVLTVASLALSLLPARPRKKSVAVGVLGMAGSLLMRFAVHYVGDRSARNPRAAFQQQHDREWKQLSRA